MFELGRATAVEATLVLRELSRGGDVPAQLVIAPGADGTLSTLTDPSQGSFESELLRALADGAPAAVAIMPDAAAQELFFCCMQRGDKRVHWTIKHRFVEGTIELSTVVDLGEGWTELRAGIYAGLNDVAAGAGLVVDAMPVNRLHVTSRLVETTVDPVFEDIGFAAGAALADTIARRDGGALAPCVVGAYDEDGEVLLESFDDLAAAIATQREEPVRGFAILEVHATRPQVSIRVPAVESPEHMRILWDASYDVADGRVRTSHAFVRGDSPVELSAFLEGFEAACDSFEELAGLDQLGDPDLEMLEGGP